MDLEIGVVAIGLSRQQAFELALGRLGAQLFERRFSFPDDRVVAFGLAEFDQLDGVVVLLLDTAIAADQMVEPIALPDQPLRRFGIIPEFRVLGLLVQLGEAPGRDIPVKDASAASSAICESHRRSPGFPRALVDSFQVRWHIHAAFGWRRVRDSGPNLIEPAGADIGLTPGRLHDPQRCRILARHALQPHFAILAGLGAGLVGH
jgi:hypothetical protein